MTVTQDHASRNVSSARDLITTEEFTAVAGTVQRNNHGMTLDVAEAITEEALKFEAACAHHPQARLKPSRVVDEGWHALILHTKVKARLAERLGLFVHHVPEPPDPTRHDPDALLRTQTAIEQAGFPVDPLMWTGPKDSTIPVAADCEHSPPGPFGSCSGDCSSTGKN
ncbi:glycine-rich domain-containing protein [Streptomyces catenulae]|uniref:Uncharacterized protein n=1 Tax=Streptomyces catenulae TaxID=66875 RepID=A0ABV2YTH7_9ACTN|nr:hypothetical protein [Streptomyces catenulae]